MTTNIPLSNDELIVLSDLLYRVNSEGILNDYFQDQAEQRALWNLESLLEKHNDQVINGNYQDVLNQARDNLRDKL